jgi:hypothetical protein
MILKSMNVKKKIRNYSVDYGRFEYVFVLKGHCITTRRNTAGKDSHPIIALQRQCKNTLKKSCRRPFSIALSGRRIIGIVSRRVAAGYYALPFQGERHIPNNKI